MGFESDQLCAVQGLQRYLAHQKPRPQVIKALRRTEAPVKSRSALMALD